MTYTFVKTMSFVECNEICLLSVMELHSKIVFVVVF